MSPMRAISAGLAEAAKSQDAVSGSGSLNVLRYGRYRRRAAWWACVAPAWPTTACTTSAA